MLCQSGRNEWLSRAREPQSIAKCVWEDVFIFQLLLLPLTSRSIVATTGEKNARACFNPPEKKYFRVRLPGGARGAFEPTLGTPWDLVCFRASALKNGFLGGIRKCRFYFGSTCRPQEITGRGLGITRKETPKSTYSGARLSSWVC